MIKRVILWVLVLSCMITIFAFSNQPAVKSKETSSGFIIAVVRFFDFYDKLSDDELNEIAEDMTYLARKSAHFCIYALLGFLVAMLLGTYNMKKFHVSLFAVLWVLVYSASDEIHQNFVPGRSMQFSDVLLDTAGGICGVITTLVFCWFFKCVKIMKGRNNNGIQRSI